MDTQPLDVVEWTLHWGRYPSQAKNWNDQVRESIESTRRWLSQDEGYELGGAVVSAQRHGAEAVARQTGRVDHLRREREWRKRRWEGETVKYV